MSRFKSVETVVRRWQERYKRKGFGRPAAKPKSRPTRHAGLRRAVRGPIEIIDVATGANTEEALN